MPSYALLCAPAFSSQISPACDLPTHSSSITIPASIPSNLAAHPNCHLKMNGFYREHGIHRTDIYPPLSTFTPIPGLRGAVAAAWITHSSRLNSTATTSSGTPRHDPRYHSVELYKASRNLRLATASICCTYNGHLMINRPSAERTQ
ncbi:hypothetical protein FKP32DRAFT_498432 [Trametes sanguinea]|nr:hypothetical protein FKP32DRAFT_498432 [Trametes sanguinea]